ncbi:MAG: methylenetetrahydrofolate reductase [Ignavibacteria bacterium]|jgi:methylenetetrahydrofolate reductase (NADPH)|nr:methylenetetrahydrofolate reductase [Ignavibacteria bacterium]
MPSATQTINELNAPAFSFELLPPIKGNSIQKVFNTIDLLKEFNPIHINITAHRDEVTYAKNEQELYERRIVRKRPGTVAVAISIQNKYGIKVIPHIICCGFTKHETEYALIDLNFLEMNDVLLLRGDNSKAERFVQTTEESNKYAIDLIHQVNDFNKGILLDNTIIEPFDNHFSFGVAGYPEKHEEAPNLQTDIEFLKEKVANGAGYIVTQMFFDNAHYYNFVDKCRKEGITVPIIPGIKPITILPQLTDLPKIFHIDLPEALVIELRKCKTNEDVTAVGIEWATAQAKDLLSNGIHLLHFYTYMAVKSVRKIAEQIY